MTWSTDDFSAVYSAVVKADNGPNTPVVYLMDARWASRDEARGYIERRLPSLYRDPRWTGMCLDVFVVPGRTSCTMERVGDGLVVQVEHIHRDWSKMETAIVQSDGSVAGWRLPT